MKPPSNPARRKRLRSNGKGDSALRATDSKLHRMSSKRAYVCLILVLAVGFSLSAYFYTGPYYAWDDGLYIEFAKQMLHNAFYVGQSPYAFGFLVPAIEALSFEAFGTGTFAAILPSTIEYTAMVVCAFLIGRRFFSEALGLLAALLVATMPFVLQYVTRVMPDMLLGALAGASIYALFSGIHGRAYDHVAVMVSGLIAGLGIFVKLGGAGLGAALLIAIIVLDRRAAPAFLSGFIISVGIYLVSFYMMTGGNIGYLGQYGAHQMAANPSTLQENLVTMAVMIEIPITIGQTYPTGFLFFRIVAATYAAARERNKHLAYMAVSFWFIWFYLFFGTVSLSSYAPMTVVSRYLIIAAVPMAILGAYVPVELYVVLSSARRKALGAAIMVALIFAIFITYIPAYSAVYSYNVSIRDHPCIGWVSVLCRS